MRPVAPRIRGHEELSIDGERYLEITAARAETDTGGSALVTRWRLTDEERARVAAGDDLFLVILGERMQPVQLHVGYPYAELEA